MATKNPYKGITFYPKMDTWCIGAYANVNGKVYHLSMTRFVYGSSIDHPIENPEWERSEHMDDWLQEKEVWRFNVKSVEEMKSYFKDDGLYQKNFLNALPQLAKLNKRKV